MDGTRDDGTRARLIFEHFLLGHENFGLASTVAHDKFVREAKSHT